MPRSLRILAPAVLLATTLAFLFVSLAIGGAADVRPILDPGAIVRYGVPISRGIMNIGMAGMIGSLVFAVWVVSNKGDELRVVMDFASASAAVVTVAATAAMIFVYADVLGKPLSGDATFGSGLGQFVTTIELGQYWMALILLSAGITVLCFAARDRRLILLALFLAIASTFPIASQGHAAGAADHSLGVNSLLVHLIGAAVWLGGLLTLVFLAKVVDRSRLAVLVSRYSVLALFAFVGVASSGVVAAVMRVGTWDLLFSTEYGVLIIMKTAALVVLGGFGAVWRQWAIRKIPGDQGGRVFAWLVVLELVAMGAASGVAAALGRSATPVALESARETGSPTVPPAEWLTGDKLPPELTPIRYLTEWKFDIAWVLVCIFAVALYIAGVMRLRKRGDKWPVGRTIAWVSGMTMLFYTTNGALNAYEQYLFSTHMLEHMMLTMLIPLVLVLGAPITLALRAVEKRHDGSWGGREWIMWMVQTPYSKIITNPVVAAVIFAGSLWIFYFTPIARWAAEEHVGHQWMIIHFLISGYLFCLSMIGIDPIPYRFPYPLRIVTLFATMASHAFFGVTIMSGNGLLMADWYGAMGREWGATPLEDQRAGGGIAWGIGELPTLALALVVALQWARSDEKEQKRKDRAADRSGEAELHAYNEMLAKRAARDQR